MERIRQPFSPRAACFIRLGTILTLLVGIRPVHADSPEAPTLVPVAATIAAAPTPPTDFELFRSADNKWVFQVTGFTGTAANITGTQTFTYTGGQGTLNVHLAGINVPQEKIPIDKVVFDANGKLTGADIKFTADKTFKNLLSTGLDVTFPANSQLSVSLAGGLTITSGKVTLPFKNTDGSAMTLSLSGPSTTAPAFQITPDGGLALKATSPMLSVRLPGFIISGQNPTLTLTHTPNQTGYDDYSVSADTVEVDAPIPGVLASRRDTSGSSSAAAAAAAAGASAGGSTGKSDTPPLHLSTSHISFNSDGEFTFQNAVFDAPNGGVILADLPALGGFYLDITHAKVSMTNSVFDAHNFELTADVHLPDDFSSDPSTQKAAVIKGLHFTANHGIVANTMNASGSGGINVFWNRLGLSADNIVLDLSSTENGNGVEKDQQGNAFSGDWKGLYLTNANLLLPDDFTTGASAGSAVGSGAGGAGGAGIGGAAGSSTSDRVKIAAKYAYITPQGFSGDVQATSVPSIKLDGFDCDLTKVAVTIDQNSLKMCDIAGTIKIEDLDNKPIKAEVGFSSAGNVNVSLSTPQPITLDSLHLTAQIDSGAFTLDENNNWKVKITGALAAADGAPDFLDGAALRVKDLTFDSQGHFDLPNGTSVALTLPDSAHIPLGPVDLILTELSVGRADTTDAAHTGQLYLGITGGVDITGLPLQLASQFEGIKLYKPGSGKPFGYSFGSIAVDASLEGVASIHGTLSDTPTLLRGNGQPPLTIATPMLDGKPMHILTGSATLQVVPLGSSAISLDFMIGQSCWFVMGGITLPTPTPIVLGQSGLGIYGFVGGIGYNVTGGTGVPMRDYIPAPDVASIQAGKTSLLFVAGTRIGQVPVPAVWGDVVLTIGLPSVVVDLSGGLSVLNPPPIPAQIPADFTKLDRVFRGGIHYDQAQQQFHASLIADLNFPTRQKNLLSAYADCELNIQPGNPSTNQPGNSYFRIGDGLHYNGDLTQIVGHPNVRKQILDSLAIDHPAYLKLTLPKSASDAGLTISPIQGILDADITNRKLSAALIFDSHFKSSGSVDVAVTVKWDADLTLSARGLIAVSWDDSSNFTAGGAFRVLAQGKVNASALSGHVKAGLDASIEGDVDGLVTLRPDSASLQLEGDLDTQLAIHVPWYGDVGFHVSPHCSVGCSL